MPKKIGSDTAPHSAESADGQVKTPEESSISSSVFSSDATVTDSAKTTDGLLPFFLRSVQHEGSDQSGSTKSTTQHHPRPSIDKTTSRNSGEWRRGIFRKTSKLSKTAVPQDSNEAHEKASVQTTVTFQDNTPTEAEYFQIYKKYNKCNAWFSLMIASTLIAEVAIFFLTTPLRYGEFLNMMLMNVGSSKHVADINCTMTKNFQLDLEGLNPRLINLTSFDWRHSTNGIMTRDRPPCPKYSVVHEVISLEFGGHFIGVAISGICGDIYGRRTVALIASAVWSVMVLALCFLKSLTSLKCVYFVCCVAGMTMAFMFYINLMEIAPRRLRMFVMYLMHMHYIAALLADVVIRYATMDWRHFQYCNAACLPVILFALWYVPESPYWLWNKNKKQRAFVFLHEFEPSEESRIGMQEQTNAPYLKLWPAVVSMMTFVFCDKFKRRPFWLFLLMTFVGSIISAISAWKLKFFEFYSNDFRFISIITVGASGLLAIPLLKYFEKKLGQVIIYVFSAVAALGVLALPFEKLQVYYNIFQVVLTLCSIHLIWYMMVDFFPTCVRATTIAFSFQIWFAVQLMVINSIYYWMQRVAREVSYALQFCTALVGFTILFMPQHQTIYLPNQKLDYV